MVIFLSIIVAFAFGSIPNGYLLAKRIKGIDIRTVGSGNIGSTNVKRILGTKLAVITQILDIAKGLIPVLLAYILIHSYGEIIISNQLYLNIVALSAILGHNYTPFLSFNGGKGVNTTIGSFFLLTPIATLSGVAMYFILKPFIEVVALRSIALGLTIPVLSYLLHVNNTVVIFSSVACVLLILRHKSNIKGIIESKRNNKEN